MQSRTAQFAKRVMKQVAWYMWTDPNLSVEVDKPITSRRSRTVVFDSARQEGDWLDYNLDVSVHSLTEMTPSMRAEQMMAIHDRIILPNQAAMQQRGDQFDVGGFVRKISEYAQIEEMGEFIQSGQAMGQDQQEVNAANQPLQTTRRYERVSRPGATRRGAEAALTQTLLGGGA